MIQRFKDALEALDVTVILSRSESPAEEIAGMLKREGVKILALDPSATALVAGLMDSCKEAGIETIPVPNQPSEEAFQAWKQKVADCDAGITSALAVAAETGTALLPAGDPDARLVSLLPPLHLLVVPEKSIVPDIGSVVAAWQKQGGQDNAVMVTGPSRTADIEKELVLGVHGPGRMIVFVFGQDGSFA